ncbi:cell wall hydrolase [Novosphingobium umbonatum]|uniref:Cell wall hydrolase n=1 Tax=Novosphingobium umbonatum TaxID=1908524 RepID=A0A3S2X2I4_9SPHN|nr:cell wall hydrolase [Novosphingobium umbonatum]RVU04054.1 cell wall hydrolase [Novosphingobium umbonatum]
MNYLLARRALLSLLSCAFGLGLAIDGAAQTTEHQAAEAQNVSQPTVSTRAAASPSKTITKAPAKTGKLASTAQAECVAKVILHEAGNQIHKGKLAVAQVIRARMKQKHADACSVVHEAGQFFNIERFRPDRSSAQWREAMGIARLTLAGKGKDVVPGALFFRSGGREFKGRLRIAQIDAHIFYR